MAGEVTLTLTEGQAMELCNVVAQAQYSTRGMLHSCTEDCLGCRLEKDNVEIRAELAATLRSQFPAWDETVVAALLAARAGSERDH